MFFFSLRLPVYLIDVAEEYRKTYNDQTLQMFNHFRKGNLKDDIDEVLISQHILLNRRSCSILERLNNVWTTVMSWDLLLDEVEKLSFEVLRCWRAISGYDRFAS